MSHFKMRKPYVRSGITVLLLIFALLNPVVNLCAVASDDELPKDPFRRGQPVRLADRKMDMRYFDLTWSGYIRHAASEEDTLLLPGKNAIWLLQPKKHSLCKAVAADWKNLHIKPSDVLGVSKDFKVGAVNLGSTTGRYPHRYRLGVADFKKSSLLATIDADWIYCDEGYKRLSHWKFNRDSKLAIALACSYANRIAWLDWGRGESISPDLSQDGIQPDSVRWTGFEIEPHVYCLVVECQRWKGLELKDRETWYRRVLLNAAPDGRVKVVDEPWNVVAVIGVEQGKVLCRLSDGRIVWIGARNWKLVASTAGVKAGALVARTSDRIVVNDQDSLVLLDATTLKKKAEIVLHEGSRLAWIGAYPDHGLLAVIDSFQGMQLFDIKTLKPTVHGPGNRVGKTVNAGTLGMTLTQGMAPFGMVATPYAQTVTIFGLKGDFVRKIQTDRHPSGAFHVKRGDAEILLIITAPVPY